MLLLVGGLLQRKYTLDLFSTFYAVEYLGCWPLMMVKKLFSALQNINCFELIFFCVFIFLQDCENLLKRFLVLNPTKRSRLEVGVFTVLVSISCSRCSLQL